MSKMSLHYKRINICLKLIFINFLIFRNSNLNSKNNSNKVIKKDDDVPVEDDFYGDDVDEKSDSEVHNFILIIA